MGPVPVGTGRFRVFLLPLGGPPPPTAPPDQKGGEGPPPCSASREPGSSPAPSTGGSPRGGIAFPAGSPDLPVDGKGPVPIPGDMAADPAPGKSPPDSLARSRVNVIRRFS